MTYWTPTHGWDLRARALADRHPAQRAPARQKPGAHQFVAPGRRLVLIVPTADYWDAQALWVTRWPGHHPVHVTT